MILENCRGSYNTIPQPEAMYGQGGPELVHILVHGAAFPSPQDHPHHQQPIHHHHLSIVTSITIITMDTTNM